MPSQPLSPMTPPARTSSVQQPKVMMSAALLSELTRPFHRKLQDEAKVASVAGNNEMAIVLSQAASEMCTEWAITALFAARENADLAEPILGLFLVTDICSDRVHRVFAALSGEKPNQQSYWPLLKTHRDRRNEVVHRGSKSTGAEASESVAVVGQYLEHAESIVSKLQAFPSK